MIKDRISYEVLQGLYDIANAVWPFVLITDGKYKAGDLTKKNAKYYFNTDSFYETEEEKRVLPHYDAECGAFVITVQTFSCRFPFITDSNGIRMIFTYIAKFEQLSGITANEKRVFEKGNLCEQVSIMTVKRGKVWDGEHGVYNAAKPRKMRLYKYSDYAYTEKPFCDSENPLYDQSKNVLYFTPDGKMAFAVAGDGDGVATEEKANLLNPDFVRNIYKDCFMRHVDGDFKDYKTVISELVRYLYKIGYFSNDETASGNNADLSHENNADEQRGTTNEKGQQAQNNTPKTAKVIPLACGDLLKVGEHILFVVSDGRYMMNGKSFSLESFLGEFYPDAPSVEIVYKRALTGYKPERMAG